MIFGNDPTFGSNSVTIDTSTGLEWLKVSFSAGLSYQQVIVDTQPGGIFDGFRFATTPEVLDLMQSAGVPGQGAFAVSTPEIVTFLSQVGALPNNNGFPGVVGLTATPDGTFGHNSVAIYVAGQDAVEKYLVTESTGYGDTFSDPGLSSWLVEPIPEPKNASLCLMAGMAWVCFRFFLRRQFRPSSR